MIRPDQLARLKQVFLQHGVILAYLFGSQAEGAARPDSDVDIAVLYSRERFKILTLDARLRLAVNICRGLGRDDVDVVVLNESPPLLAYEVVRYGKMLYEDPETHPATDFAALTFTRFADTAPLRAVQDRYFLERIRERSRITGIPEAA